MSKSIFCGDYTVFIKQNISKVTNDIFLMKRDDSANVFMKGDGTAIRVEHAAPAKDDELVFAEMSDDQLAAFAEAIYERGIKPNHDSVTEGKLQATERHLEDMRTIALAKYQSNQSDRS